MPATALLANDTVSPTARVRAAFRTLEMARTIHDAFLIETGRKPTMTEMNRSLAVMAEQPALAERFRSAYKAARAASREVLALRDAGAETAVQQTSGQQTSGQQISGQQTPTQPPRIRTQPAVRQQAPQQSPGPQTARHNAPQAPTPPVPTKDTERRWG